LLSADSVLLSLSPDVAAAAFARLLGSAFKNWPVVNDGADFELFARKLLVDSDAVFGLLLVFANR
jgi:hypothetical protein